MNTKFATLLVSAAVVAAGGGVATASGSVERYQTQTLTIQDLNSGVSRHTIVVTLSPCDGTFTGTGIATDYPTVSGYNTVVTGSLVKDVLTYTATQVSDGYSFTNTATVSGGTFVGSGVVFGQTYPTSGTLTRGASSSYANHGAYVSSVGGGSAAAHSCIGRPVQSKG